MKFSLLAVALAGAASAAPAPGILASSPSASSTYPYPSAYSTYPYPSASSTEPYPSSSSTEPYSSAASTSPYPSISSSYPYPSASCTESYCLSSGSSGLPNPSGFPAPNDATADEITYSIEVWEEDVDHVNAFLNTALSLTGAELAAAAQVALNFAQDEPVKLARECALPHLSQAGLAACATLQEDFGKVIIGLEGIIGDPDYGYNVRQNLEIINEARCSIVLPNLDILWAAAARASGAKIHALKAERPEACQYLEEGPAEEYGAEKKSEGEKMEGDGEKAEGEGEKEVDEGGKEGEFQKEGEAEFENESEGEGGRRIHCNPFITSIRRIRGG